MVCLLLKKIFSRNNQKCVKTQYFFCAFNSVNIHIPMNKHSVWKHCLRSKIPSFLKLIWLVKITNVLI